MDDQRVDRTGGRLLSGGRNLTWIVLAIVILAIAPFIPLVLSIIEGSCFGTHYTERAFEQIGLHKSLDNFYEACWRLISGSK